MPRPGVHDAGDELLTVTEVLQQIRVAPATWYRWRQTRQAPRAIKLPNGELRIRRSALAKWLREREEPDREEQPDHEAPT